MCNQYRNVSTTLLNHLTIEKVKGSLLDIYARAGKLQEAEELFAEMKYLDCFKWGIMIRAYAKNNQPQKATDILNRLLEEDDKIRKDKRLEHLFCGVIDAWAESSHPNAWKQGCTIFRRIVSTCETTEGNETASVASYGALLKCLVNSPQQKDEGHLAQTLLDEMEEHGLAPNVICFTLAIRACFNAEDLERAERLMMRMLKSQTPPTIRTFTEILRHYAEIGTMEAAVRCESILDHLKYVAETKPELRPDGFCYSVAMSAWANSKVPDASERVFRLYEEMLSTALKPDSVNCNQILSSLAKSKQRGDIKRADDMLRAMESMTDNYEIPNSIHYMTVMVRKKVMNQIFFVRFYLTQSQFEYFCRKDGPR